MHDPSLAVERARAHNPSMISREIEFCSHTGNLSLVRRFVREFLKELNCGETCMDLMVLGIDEACTNVIRYAYACAPDGLIKLKLEATANAVRCRLRDYGCSANHGGMNGRSLEVVRPGGLGLHLIRKAFDDTYYLRRPKGTELVLIKSIAASTNGEMGCSSQAA